MLDSAAQRVCFTGIESIPKLPGRCFSWIVTDPESVVERFEGCREVVVSETVAPFDLVADCRDDHG